MQHLAACALSIPTRSSRDTPLQKSRSPVTDEHDAEPGNNARVETRHRTVVIKCDMLKPASYAGSFNHRLCTSKVVVVFS